MKELSKIIFLTVSFSLISACKSNVYNYVYKQALLVDCDSCDYQGLMGQYSDILNNRTTITLLNDTILKYDKKHYDLGCITNIRYKRLDNNKIIVDSLDVYGRDTPISNSVFVLSKDSLYNINTNMIFFRSYEK